MKIIAPYQDKIPRIDSTAFIAPNTSLIGELDIGAYSSIWFGSVLRGDVMPIKIGERSSIQDGSILHATGGWAPTLVGDDCTVGHGVILHGCTVEDRVLVGMGSVVLDGAVIGQDTIIGASSLITPRTQIPSGVLAIGSPAKPVRDLTEEERKGIVISSELYVKKCKEYLEMHFEESKG